MAFEFFLLALFGALFLLILIVRIIEPTYVLIFNKPLYLYWYPFPKKIKPAQRRILVNNFSFYNRLSAKRKVYFEHRIQSFLDYYQFIGKGNMEVTDEMKMLISGTYIMLTFGMRNYLIDLFKKIIIYPTHYYSTITNENHKGEYNPRLKAVVFSWEDFLSGHQDSNDNINLGLHEFSHVLHFHCMKSNDSSAIIFFDEFNEIVKYYKDVQLNAILTEKGYFREYAYENQFEFLSVIIENYFESPDLFREEFPQLYDNVSKMLNHTH